MERITTIHTFQPDEPYFEGHFPGNPIVPGVVLIECMAQACRLMMNVRAGEIVPGFLVGVETGKFLSVVRPNETVSFDCRLERSFADPAGAAQPIYMFGCYASVGDIRCARAYIMWRVASARDNAIEISAEATAACPRQFSYEVYVKVREFYLQLSTAHKKYAVREPSGGDDEFIDVWETAGFHFVKHRHRLRDFSHFPVLDEWAIPACLACQ